MLDNIWIYIFIIGIALSFAQKNKKKRVEQQSDSPEVDPRQEWERQIRELLGEPKQAQTQPEVEAEVRPVVTPQNTTPECAVSAPKYAKLGNNSHATTNGKANFKTAAKAASKPLAESNTTEEAPNENIEKIIDDFSMEKAVIYAEILKPKYEEY